jgi:SAM-dependent methyltransferase
MIKVNLGSGTNTIEGWINIDKSWNIYLSKFPTVKRILYKLGVIPEGAFQADWKGKNVIRHDVKKGLPFEDESVNFIYCSHLLEHLTRDDAKKVCQEAYRVLKKDGIFRVVVPDLKLLAEKYVESDRKFFGGSPKPTADLFLESLGLEGLRKRPILERILCSLHKYMYDAESLTFLLRSAGFQDVRERNFREGACPDLKEIENRARSVYIEARK